MYHANTWVQASQATSDYFNGCGNFASYPSGHCSGPCAPAALPLPGQPGGQGLAGFIWEENWNEMVGACLTSPMVAGTLYVMNMWIAKAGGPPDLPFRVYGTTTCSDLPWAHRQCPVGTGSWEVLGETLVDFPTNGDWYEITVSFTPTEDIYAIALGGDCTSSQSTTNRYYVDELTLADSEQFVC